MLSIGSVSRSYRVRISTYLARQYLCRISLLGVCASDVAQLCISIVSAAYRGVVYQNRIGSVS